MRPTRTLTDDLELKVRVRTAELAAANRALQVEVHQRRRTEADLAEEIRSLRESIVEGRFGLDRDGCFTSINRAAAAMLGREPGELLGRASHAVLCPAGDAARHAES